jgi:hypothetical protein
MTLIWITKVYRESLTGCATSVKFLGPILPLFWYTGEKKNVIANFFDSPRIFLIVKEGIGILSFGDHWFLKHGFLWTLFLVDTGIISLELVFGKKPSCWVWLNSFYSIHVYWNQMTNTHTHGSTPSVGEIIRRKNQKQRPRETFPFECHVPKIRCTKVFYIYINI